jgi:hypothetical protein
MNPDIPAETWLRLFGLMCRLKNDILLAQPARRPVSQALLPPSILAFLSKACNITEEDVRACWESMKDIVWQEEVLQWSLIGSEVATEAVFQQHGREYGFRTS